MEITSEQLRCALAYEARVLEVHVETSQRTPRRRDASGLVTQARDACVDDAAADAVLVERLVAIADLVDAMAGLASFPSSRRVVATAQRARIRDLVAGARPYERSYGAPAERELRTLRDERHRRA